jgi:hypothetical protein
VTARRNFEGSRLDFPEIGGPCESIAYTPQPDIRRKRTGRNPVAGIPATPQAALQIVWTMLSEGRPQQRPPQSSSHSIPRETSSDHRSSGNRRLGDHDGRVE